MNWKTIVFSVIVLFGCASGKPSEEKSEKENYKTPTNITKIEIYKASRELWAYEGDTVVKKYKVSLGKNPVGHKHFEGDNKTPEGKYKIDGKNPHSSYHKNLGISYPNEQDKAYAKKFNKSPGGLIKIHGLPNGSGNIGKAHLLSDWTAGCIAVTDKEIDELYAATKVGTIIIIYP